MIIRFGLACSRVKWSKKQVQEHIKQFAIIPLFNHGYHGRLYVNCPDPEWRVMLAEVVYEEGTGRLFSDGVSHHELYLRLGEAMDISRDEMRATLLLRGGGSEDLFRIHLRPNFP